MRRCRPSRRCAGRAGAPLARDRAVPRRACWVDRLHSGGRDVRASSAPLCGGARRLCGVSAAPWRHGCRAALHPCPSSCALLHCSATGGGPWVRPVCVRALVQPHLLPPRGVQRPAHVGAAAGALKGLLAVSCTFPASDEFVMLPKLAAPQHPAPRTIHINMPLPSPPLVACSSAFTIHGLWPEYSTGGWPEFCDGNRSAVQAAHSSDRDGTQASGGGGSSGTRRALSAAGGGGGGALRPVVPQGGGGGGTQGDEGASQQQICEWPSFLGPSECEGWLGAGSGRLAGQEMVRLCTCTWRGVPCLRRCSAASPCRPLPWPPSLPLPRPPRFPLLPNPPRSPTDSPAAVGAPPTTLSFLLNKLYPSCLNNPILPLPKQILDSGTTSGTATAAARRPSPATAPRSSGR